MRIRFLFLILFLSSILSCTRENNSPYSYRLLGSAFVETSRPISPTDTLAIVPCISISIQNNGYDSLVLYHDRAGILDHEGAEAFSARDEDCGYVSIADGISDDRTTLFKNDSQTFYLAKPKLKEGCSYDC